MYPTMHSRSMARHRVELTDAASREPMLIRGRAAPLLPGQRAGKEGAEEYGPPEDDQERRVTALKRGSVSAWRALGAPTSDLVEHQREEQRDAARVDARHDVCHVGHGDARRSGVPQGPLRPSEGRRRLSRSGGQCVLAAYQEELREAANQEEVRGEPPASLEGRSQVGSADRCRCDDERSAAAGRRKFGAVPTGDGPRLVSAAAELRSWLRAQSVSD